MFILFDDKMKIEDGPAGIEELISERLEAKKSKDFNRADQIRSAFEVYGIQLLDGPDGTTTWEKK
jgi:cysteinyl-tRNA synthetase